MKTIHPRTGPLALKAIIAIATLGLLLAASSATLTPVAQGSGGVSAEGGDGTTAGSGDKYRRLWSKIPRRQKRWANRVAECESGKDPRAIGGGGKYRGAFQFLRRTWRHAPKSPGGDPIRYRYRVQAVVAVHLKRKAGSSPWPNCG